MKTMPAGHFKARCLKVMDVQSTREPITQEIAIVAAQFPESYPRDPADRLIGATARAEGIALITQDERIRSSPLLRTIW